KRAINCTLGDTDGRVAEPQEHATILAATTARIRHVGALGLTDMDSTTQDAAQGTGVGTFVSTRIPDTDCAGSAYVPCATDTVSNAIDAVWRWHCTGTGAETSTGVTDRNDWQAAPSAPNVTVGVPEPMNSAEPSGVETSTATIPPLSPNRAMLSAPSPFHAATVYCESAGAPAKSSTSSSAIMFQRSGVPFTVIVPVAMGAP